MEIDEVSDALPDGFRLCTCMHQKAIHIDKDGPCGVEGCPCSRFEQKTFTAQVYFAPNDGKTGSESVDHPQHYGGGDDPYEHIKVCEAKGWGYHIGNCTKYLWRVGKKDPEKFIEDLEKARWYLDRYIALLKGRQT